jgi:hypothetical protein
MPPLRELSLLANLAPVCQQYLAEGGQDIDLPQQQAVYSALVEKIGSLFAAQAFESSQCGSFLRQELGGDLYRIFAQCVR